MPPPRPGAVLLVEDEEIDAKRVLHMLEHYNYGSVTWVRTHAEMRQHEGPVELVLLDLSIPGAPQHLDFVVDVVSRWPSAAVVLLTGLDDREFVVESQNVGAQNRMLKGNFDAKSLDLCIRGAYAAKRFADEKVRRLREEMRFDPKKLHTVVAEAVLGATRPKFANIESHLRELAIREIPSAKAVVPPTYGVRGKVAFVLASLLMSACVAAFVARASCGTAPPRAAEGARP